MAAKTTQRVLWTVLIVALLGIGAFALNDWLKTKVIATPSRIIPVMGKVPDFTLTSQENKPFGTADLKGKIWVVDLIFTNCGGTCPMLTSEMATLQKSVAKTPDVHLVSITVDPHNDTPEVLAEYAKKFMADTKTWHFLTGPVSTIYTIAREGFKLTVDSTAGDPQSPILHSERFVLVDKNGNIRAFYDGTEAETKQKLLADIRDLFLEERAAQ
jgi:protein SCO1/2